MRQAQTLRDPPCGVRAGHGVFRSYRSSALGKSDGCGGNGNRSQLPANAAAACRPGPQVVQLEEPLELPSSPRMPVRFVVSYVVVSNGLSNLILEGLDGADKRVRAPLPLPLLTWNVQDGANGSALERGDSCVANWEPERAAAGAQTGSDLGAKACGAAVTTSSPPPLRETLQAARPLQTMVAGKEASPALSMETPGTPVPAGIAARPAPVSLAQYLAGAKLGAAERRSSNVSVETPGTPVPAGVAARPAPVSLAQYLAGAKLGAAERRSSNVVHERRPPPPVQAKQAGSHVASAAAVRPLSPGAQSSHPARGSEQPRPQASRGPSGSTTQGTTSTTASSYPRPNVASQGRAVPVGASPIPATPAPPAHRQPQASSPTAQSPTRQQVPAPAPATTPPAPGALGRDSHSSRTAPVLVRPDAPPVSQILSCFNPTTLVSRWGTVQVGGQEQPRRLPGRAAPAAPAAPPAWPQPHRPRPAPGAAGGAPRSSDMSPLLQVLRQVPAPEPWRRSAGSGARWSAGGDPRPPQGQQNRGSGAEASSSPGGAGLTAPQQAAGRSRVRPKYPANFNPTVVVSRTGVRSVRSSAVAPAPGLAGAGTPQGRFGPPRGAADGADGDAGGAAAGTNTSSLEGGDGADDAIWSTALLQVLRAATSQESSLALAAPARWRRDEARQHNPGREATSTSRPAARAPSPPALPAATPEDSAFGAGKLLHSLPLPSTKPSLHQSRSASDMGARDERGSPTPRTGAPPAASPAAQVFSALRRAQAPAAPLPAPNAAAAAAAAAAKAENALPAAPTTRISVTPASGQRARGATEPFNPARQLCVSSSLEQLSHVLEQHLDRMGFKAVGLACRVLVGLLRRAAGAVPRRAGVSELGPTQRGVEALHGRLYGCLAALQELRQRAEHLGQQACDQLRAAASTAAPRGGAGSPLTRSGDGGAESLAAASAAAAPMPALPPQGNGQHGPASQPPAAAGDEQSQQDPALAVALGRRMLGRLARRTAALLAAEAADAQAAEGGACSGWAVSRTATEAVMGVLWAYSHLAESASGLELQLGEGEGSCVLELWAGLEPGAGTVPGGKDSPAPLPALVQAVLKPAQSHPGDVAVDASPESGARGQPLLASKASRRQRLADAGAAAAKAPLRSVLGGMWVLLLREVILPRPRPAGLPPPARPPTPPRREWLLWALWSAAHGAPAALPEVLQALLRERTWAPPPRRSTAGPTPAAAAAGGSSGGGQRGLEAFSAGELVSVLWGCSRFADWLEAQREELGAAGEESEDGAVAPAAWDRSRQAVAHVAAAAFRLLAAQLALPDDAAQEEGVQDGALQQQPGPRLSRDDLLVALRAAALLLDGAEFEQEALVLLTALAAQPHLRLPDLCAALNMVRHWMPRLQRNQAQAQGQAGEPAQDVSDARGMCLLRLQVAVVALLGAASREQAEALVGPGLRGLGLRPVRGWYRRQLRMPGYAGQQQVGQDSPLGGEGGPSGPSGPQQVPAAGGGAAGELRGGAGRARRRQLPLRRYQHALPFRLRLLYGISDEEAMGAAPAHEHAAAAAVGTQRPQAVTVGQAAAQGAHNPAAAVPAGHDGAARPAERPPTSLELQLRHQQRVWAEPAVRSAGSADLLALLSALAGACAVAGARARPATVRCVLNALALRWLSSGVPERDVAALLAVLYGLDWRPRAAVTIFTTAWRPFVVLLPGGVSDAALAGMAQALGRLTSHDMERCAALCVGGRPGEGEGGSSGDGKRRGPAVGQALAWPKLRTFWTNVVALATSRVRGGGGLAPAPTGTSAGAGGAGSGATTAPAVSVATLVRMVWSCARQGARVPHFMGMSCQLLLPLLPRLPAGTVGMLAWGLGQPRFMEPRMSEALLALLRRWLAAEDCNWTAACRVAWALLRLRRIGPAAPELFELLQQLEPALQRPRWPAPGSAGSAARQPRVQRLAGPPSQGRAADSAASQSLRQYGPQKAALMLAVNPRALAALLWAIRDEAGGWQLASSAGGGGGRLVSVASPLDDASLFRSAASFLARHSRQLPPSALLQVLQVMASGNAPARLRSPEFMDAFSRMVEQRPLWLLRTETQVRLVLRCYRRLGWWPAAQVEELAARGARLAEVRRQREHKLTAWRVAARRQARGARWRGLHPGGAP